MTSRLEASKRRINIGSTLLYLGQLGLVIVVAAILGVGVGRIFA